MKRTYYSIFAVLLTIFIFNSCKKAKEKPQEANPIENIKDIKLTIGYTATTDAILPSTFKDTVSKAQDLLTKVFSSKDFRDELYKRNFHDSAYSKSTSACFSRIYGSTVRGKSIAGKAVYDNLLPSSTFSLTINIRKNGDNTSTLGSASACGSRITTNDYWLKITEKKLAYRLARHWAHEYTHIRGYRHDSNVPSGYKWGNDVNKDPAYGVGDVVGIVLDKWLAAGIIK